MEKTHYFLHYSHCSATKNKLQESVHAYLKSIDKMLVKCHQLSIVQKTILDKINELNEEHKRCTPLRPRFHQYFKGDDYSLHGVEFAVFHLKPAQLVKFATP